MTARVKQRDIILLPVLVCLFSMIAVSAFWLREYRQAAFSHVSAVTEMIIEADPAAEARVLSAVKQYHDRSVQEVNGNQFLARYGYRSGNFFNGLERRYVIVSAVLFLVTAGGFLAAAGYTDRQNRIRITELTDYLEQVNSGADGTIMQRSEDKFSHLQDEMYKTVTALYQTREAAVTAKRNFADNLANIAHQLKTPITAAGLSLQLMEQAAPDGYAGYIKQVKSQLKRLHQLEESLLTLSRIDAGTLLLEHARVDIYTALNLAADHLSDLLAAKHVAVSIPDHGCIEITGDLEWTMEALINLIKNCLEHSPPGGTIHCDYSCNPLYVEVLIRDEGEGFDPEDIPHLFERFYRGKRSARGGTGIGLSLARSVFELQNGTVTARSLPQGGACFEIRVYSH